MKATRLDHRVHDTIMNADRARGMDARETADKLSVVVVRIVGSIDRLEEDKFIEARWENERWPNGDRAPIVHSTSTSRARARYYRLTCKTRQTLAARLRESLS